MIVRRKEGTFEIGANIMKNAHDTIAEHFANWGDETNAHDGFAAFAWDALDETRTALGDGSGEQFDQLALDVAYSVNQEGADTVTEAQAAAWILEERDELVEAVDAAIALRDE